MIEMMVGCSLPENLCVVGVCDVLTVQQLLQTIVIGARGAIVYQFEIIISSGCGAGAGRGAANMRERERERLTAAPWTGVWLKCYTFTLALACLPRPPVAGLRGNKKFSVPTNFRFCA